MAVGTLRCTVVNVGDLEVGERFWSELTGLPVMFSAVGAPTPYSRLGMQDEQSILLQLSDDREPPTSSRVHIDVTVEDLDVAVEQAGALGATFVRRALYPPEGAPFLEHAVMTDPFGNEFCLIKPILARKPDGEFVKV